MQNCKQNCKRNVNENLSLTHQNGLSVYTFNFYYFKFIDALPFVYKINLIKAIQDFHKNKHNFENFKKLSFLKIK